MNTARSLISTIAGFSAIGFAALAVIYGVIVAVPHPELNPTSWDWTLRILVIAAIVSFSVYLLAAPESVGQVASKRSTRFTANALIAALVAIGVAILLNVIADRFATASADLTAGKTFTLSDQTAKILDNMKTDVKVLAFYNAQANSTVRQEQVDDLLNSYKSRSGGHITTELVDYLRDPGRAYAYLQTSTGDISNQWPAVVFDNGKKRETTHDITEAGFTTALLQLEQNTTPTVAFLTGHGERDSNSASQEGYDQVRQQLSKENYKLTTLDLITGTLSVSDTNVLVIAEPQRPLTSKEVQAVQKYLDEGGRALIMLDTLTLSGSQPTDAFNSLKPIIEKYGVTPVQGAVLDAKSVQQLGPAAVLVNSYPSGSEITSALQSGNLNTLFYVSAGLKPPTSTVDNMQVTSIIQSSTGEQLSFLDTDIKPGGPAQPRTQYDPSKDVPGPVSMAVTIAPTDTATNTVKTKLVVFGDSDFASNFVISQVPNNLDLFANSVSWLAGANDLVSIRAKAPDAPRQITVDENQQRVIFFSSVVGLPLLVLLMGAFVWWRRR